MDYNDRNGVLVTGFGLPQGRMDFQDSAKATWTRDGIAIRHEYWDRIGGDHVVLVYRLSKISNHKAVHTGHSAIRLGYGCHSAGAL